MYIAAPTAGGLGNDNPSGGEGLNSLPVYACVLYRCGLCVSRFGSRVSWCGCGHWCGCCDCCHTSCGTGSVYRVLLEAQVMEMWIDIHQFKVIPTQW